jgi:hypothetical protein
MAQAGPTRRSVLVAGGLAVLVGCSRDDAAEVEAAPSAPTRLRLAVAEEIRGIEALYAAVLSRHPGLRDTAGPLAAEHRAHRLAVLEGVPEPSRTTVTSGATPAPTRSATRPRVRPTDIPGSPGLALAALVTAERAAARRRADQATVRDPLLARLLASIGASCAGHAALLERA